MFRPPIDAQGIWTVVNDRRKLKFFDAGDLVDATRPQSTHADRPREGGENTCSIHPYGNLYHNFNSLTGRGTYVNTLGQSFG